MINKDLYECRKLLYDWYEHHKRDLPWRGIRDPYRIWISEIILQQTRVNQGYDYYLRFVRRFPTVSDLAQAQEEEVLKLWQGLGYYSRARNLYKAAHQVMDDFNGVFPDTYEGLLRLSGVGEYTAAAIASFAYKLPHAVLDGNVFRVLARLQAEREPINSTLGRKIFKHYADDFLDKEQPDRHNQAMMEFGALHCKPIAPSCGICPLEKYCIAYQTNSVQTYPVKIQKVKQKKRYFHYIVLKKGKDTFIEQRKGSDIWQHLYQFPLVETQRLLGLEELLQSDILSQLLENVGHITWKAHLPPLKHILTHQTIHTHVYVAEIEKIGKGLEKYERIAWEMLSEYPISRLMELIIEKMYERKIV